MDSITDTGFNSSEQLALASSMYHFFLSNVAFAAPTSKLDKDVQDDRERYRTRHCSNKRDMAFSQIAVPSKGNHVHYFSAG
jgi:hypothetical protein